MPNPHRTINYHSCDPENEFPVHSQSSHQNKILLRTYNRYVQVCRSIGKEVPGTHAWCAALTAWPTACFRESLFIHLCITANIKAYIQCSGGVNVHMLRIVLLWIHHVIKMEELVSSRGTVWKSKRSPVVCIFLGRALMLTNAIYESVCTCNSFICLFSCVFVFRLFHVWRSWKMP